MWRLVSTGGVCARRVVGVGLALSLVSLMARAEPPTIRILSSSRPQQSVGLSIRPNTNGWVQIEASADLVDWRPLANLLTTNTTGPYVDDSTSNTPARFYRVRRPGVSVAEAAAAWTAARPSHYRHRFETFFLTNNGALLWQGTVSVSNGVKSVAEVTLNGFPTNAFDAAIFLTPDEVFEALAVVEAGGVQLAHVSYHPQWSHPVAVSIVWGGNQPIQQWRLFSLEAVVGP